MRYILSLTVLLFSLLKINLPDDTRLLNLTLDSSLGKREPKLNLYLKDKQKNILEVGILSSENSNGELMKGYIKSTKFKLDDAYLHNSLISHEVRPEFNFSQHGKSSGNHCLFDGL